MSERQTTVSRSIEYDIAECSHCNDKVFIDNERENVDGLPEGIPLVIGGGEQMSVNKTDPSTLSKNHWCPEVVIKWFTSDGQSADLTEQYLCRACAKSLYGE
jgi:hypothetical protein